MPDACDYPIDIQKHNKYKDNEEFIGLANNCKNVLTAVIFEPTLPIPTRPISLPRLLPYRLTSFFFNFALHF